MANVPATARVVVIGAGIVGNSLVYHLARLGWRDIVQIDKGPLPNPGGSTGHASNFIFPVDHSREITDLTLDSVEQYQEMGVFTESGGFEVARTEERMEELRRRMSSAKAWGIEAELVTPEQVKEKVPFLETDQIIGAFWTPSVGVVDSLRAGTIMRERRDGARRADRRTQRRGRRASTSRTAGSAACAPSGGDIEAETVVIACGVWSPKIAEMAGAAHPADPRGAPDDLGRPLPAAGRPRGRDHVPDRARHGHVLLRASARRRHGGRLLRAPARSCMDADDIPSIEASKLSPTELPFTEEDFDPQLEQAFELMPDLLGAEGAEIRYAINGLLSLTPDGWPILGETPEVQRPLVRRRGLDQGGPRRRPRRRRVDDPRALRDRHLATPTSPGSTPTSSTRAHIRARTDGGVQQDLRDHPPGGAVRVDRPQRLAPMHARSR